MGKNKGTGGEKGKGKLTLINQEKGKEKKKDAITGGQGLAWRKSIT